MRSEERDNIGFTASVYCLDRCRQIYSKPTLIRPHRNGVGEFFFARHPGCDVNPGARRMPLRELNGLRPAWKRSQADANPVRIEWFGFDSMPIVRKM